MELDERMPRAADRRNVRSGRERLDVSSLGVMYCIAVADGRVAVGV